MCQHDSLQKNDLRIQAAKKGRSISIAVNGSNIQAYEGETVHAALTASGILNLRTTRDGEARGVFCGMGICYDCLVTIDNVPNQRACMTIVRDKMEISIQGVDLKSPNAALSEKGVSR